MKIFIGIAEARHLLRCENNNYSSCLCRFLHFTSQKNYTGSFRQIRSKTKKYSRRKMNIFRKKREHNLYEYGDVCI